MQGDERLRKLRDEIDIIDAKIMLLLHERFAAAKSIGEIKRQLGLEILQQDRELEVIKRVGKSAVAAGINGDFAEKLFSGIMAESGNMQKRKNVQK